MLLKNSFYNWDILPAEVLHRWGGLVNDIINDFIVTYDLLSAANTFVNHDNITNDQFIKSEHRMIGLKKLFRLGKVTDLSHRSILLDIAYQIARETQGGDLKPMERASQIQQAWRTEILRLRDLKRTD